LKNKYRKDFADINKHIAKRKEEEDIEWFEKKYKINISNYKPKKEE